MRIYDALFAHFGPQHWWPARTPFEVAVGAILTQNTNWGNVERAIANLRKARCLSARGLYRIDEARLAELLRPSGYFRVKARRLKAFVETLVERHGGSLKRLFALGLDDARRELLSVNGIGPETADSILLYAGGLVTFVVDAYTKRVMTRHRVAPADASYDDLKRLFEESLPPDTALFNEYHALLVMTGKHYCKPRPLCADCPLQPLRDSRKSHMGLQDACRRFLL